MKLNFKQTAVAVFIIISLVWAVVWQVSAQQAAASAPAAGSASVQANYELTGSVGAGGAAVFGIYQTDVMIGQPAVGHSANGEYDLGSGFWGGGTLIGIIEEIYIYLPLILR